MLNHSLGLYQQIASNHSLDEITENEKNTLTNLHNSVVDIYHYYDKNQVIFKSFQKQMQTIKELANYLTAHSSCLNGNGITTVFNGYKKELQEMRNKCLEFEIHDYS